MKLPSLHKTTGADSGGFTLAEVTIAVAICMIGLVGVLGLLSNALKDARDTTDQAMAARLADAEFTNVRANALVSYPPNLNRDPWGAASTTVAVHYYDPYGNDIDPSDTARYNRERYFYVRITSTNRTAAHGRINDVTVVVRWPLLSARSTSNTFVTSIAKYEKP